MALNATNFVSKGPVLHADMLQFYNLFTGVMSDQPVTFRNTLNVGGNQTTSTVPLKLYGAVGQTSHLIDLYADPGQAQPGFGFGAIGTFGWGPGGTGAQDTFLSRIATQNGHASDTAGLFVQPRLEVSNSIQAGGYYFNGGGDIVWRAAGELQVDNTLYVVGGIGIGNDPQPNMGLYITGSDTGAFEYGIRCVPTISTQATQFAAAIEAGCNLSAGSVNTPNIWALSAIAPVLGAGRTVNSSIGLEIHNMGGAGIASAWGLFIDQQSGSTNNIGIENRAQSVLHDNVSIDGAYNSNPNSAPLQVTGIPNAAQWTVGVTSANMNGAGGVYILAGQSGSDYTLLCRTRDGTHDGLRVRGDGWVTVGWNNQITVGPGNAVAHVNGALLTSVTLEGDTTLAGNLTNTIHDTGAVDRSAYSDGNLVLQASNVPRIGFLQQADDSAVCLYKQPGSESLRVIGSDGADGALVIDTFVQTLRNKTLVDVRTQAPLGFAGAPGQSDLSNYALNSGAGTFVLPTPGANWMGVLRLVRATGDATVTSEGQSVCTLGAGQAALLYCDGSQWWPFVTA
jgi:hypothetical protein